ncbi:MAG: ParA family protein [Myxococcota bacterium]
MKSLVVASQKGGVGKTTLSLNLSFAFAKAGFRTALIDADPQGAVGLSLSKSLTVRKGLADCVAGEASAEEALVRTRVEDFALMPVGTISPVETHSFGSALADGTRLRALTDQLSGAFDLVVIDTPCGFGGITAGALRACSYAISPIQAEPIALRSVTQLLEMIKALGAEGPVARMAGFVLSMLQTNDASSLQVARDVWDMFPRELLFDVSVPRDGVFLEATAAGVPVGLLRRPAPPVTHVFDLVAAEVARRMELQTTRTVDGPQSLLD